MFERFRERSYERRVDALKKLPLIGSTVALPERGVVIQAPHPTLMKRLMRIDGRIKYVPFDYSQLKEETGEYTYWAGVTRNLGHRVRKDLPVQRLAMRGTALSIRDEYQHYDLEEATHDVRKWNFPVDPQDHRQMNNVLTVLRTGTDRGGLLTTHMGGMAETNELHNRVAQWLANHGAFEIRQAAEVAGRDMADNIFPTLLVYDADNMAGTRERRIKDPSALLALYVTDRFVGLDFIAEEAL